MNTKLFKLCLRGLGRRRKEIMRACAATLLAMFFVTGVLIFQENMYQWQMAANKERFGDWFVMELNRENNDITYVSHPYLSNSKHACSKIGIYDDAWQDVNAWLGYMTDEFISKGHIKVEQGRMPQNNDDIPELAMDYNTLSQLGYSMELNQKITVNYYDGSNKDENKCRKEYILVGIVRSYTNSWAGGSNLPGALVTEEEAETYNNIGQDIYIYPLKSNITTRDYQPVYNNIKDNSQTTLVYNNSVYDYQLWGPKVIYTYMYLLVLIIGVTILTYQIIAYDNTRAKYNNLMRRLGATKRQIKIITFAENMLIIVPSSLLGILASGLIGKLVCMLVEHNMQITFYRMNIAVFAKSLLSMVAAVLVVEVVSAVNRKHGERIAGLIASNGIRSDRNSGKAPKHLLNARNLSRVMHKRIVKTNGILQNAAVRFFALAVCIVITACIWNVSTAYKAYQENDSLPDLMGYKQETDDFMYLFNYFTVDRRSSSFSSVDATELINADMSKMSAYYEQMYEQLKEQKGPGLLLTGKTDTINHKVWELKTASYSKNGNTNMLKGFSEELLQSIESVPGVSSVNCSIYETERTWTWDGISYEKMGMDKIAKKAPVKHSVYGDRYLFATKYAEPTEEFYNKLSKYIAAEYIDYDAYARGEQVIVFLQDNPYGEYDDTLTVGKNINYMYYDVPIFGGYNGNINKTYPYFTAFAKAYVEKMKQDNPERSKEYDGLYNDYTQGAGTYYYYLGLYGSRLWYELNFEACVSPVCVAVIRVTDEVKEEFANEIVEYGYYTAVASTNLAQKACDRQNDFMTRVLEKELPEDAVCKLMYNQISVNYDISSAFSATGNIVSSYCRNANVKFVTHDEEKFIQRNRTITAVLQYGITLAAVFLINVLVYVIIINSRFAIRKQKYIQLSRMGMDKGTLCRICMMESVRESLWCIFTLPVILLVSWVIYKSSLKKLI